MNKDVDRSESRVSDRGTTAEPGHGGDVARKNDTEYWGNYGDSCVSSIYLSVYRRVLSKEWAQNFKQKVIEQINGTTIVNMTVCGLTYSWIPHVSYIMSVPGKPPLLTDPLKTPDVAIHLDLDHYAPDHDEVFAALESSIACKEIRLHGLMNVYSMKNGTKGNKNRFALWFIHEIMSDPEVTLTRNEVQGKLAHKARSFLTDPERNQEYLKRRYELGKKGVIQQLKELKHLPLETIRDAVREFLCMDVMDGFDE